jgi:hypothetical protein
MPSDIRLKNKSRNKVALLHPLQKSDEPEK